MTALIEAGADPLLVNAQGFKPSQFASSKHTALFKVSDSWVGSSGAYLSQPSVLTCNNLQCSLVTTFSAPV